MAQPIFDEHPLQDYLRQSGDVFEPIPGAISGLSCPFSDGSADNDPDHDLKLCWWLRTPTVRLAEFFNVVVTSVQNHHSTLQEFSERFKYDVISSSLLSSSITAPSTRRRSSDGALSDDSDSNPTAELPPPPTPSQPVANRGPARILSLGGLCLIAIFFDCFLLYVSIVTALYYLESRTLASTRLPDSFAPTFAALKDLIAAAHLWDSTVHEAINLLELDESIAPSSPPSSPLRAALHSALLATQTQFDNVRHVLVGLTSPSSLAQLSEMYSPPSPMKPQVSPHARSGSTTPASSFPAASTSASEKRKTWNGSVPFSYAALAEAGSPSRQSLKRWEKRRSDVSALLLQPSGLVMSAPATPQPLRSLEGVNEETANPLKLSIALGQETDADVAVPPEERGQFGSAALELRRQRRSKGIETFLPSTRSPPPKYTPIGSQPPFPTHIVRLGNKSPQSSPTSPRSSFSPTRFTAMQIPRHPLSLHSLTLALNGALAARRYAASHLLALRFGGADRLNDTERASESYWEDVRAVIALLTTALANATAPLIEALDAAERERLQAENPTPSESHSRSTSTSEHAAQASPLHQQQQQQEQQERRRRRRQAHRSSWRFASFAPLPSHLTRFATHVEALTNALNDARENLESCVSSLRDRDPTALSSSRDAADEPTLHAYERLRRELGLALRECERGREPLLELLHPPSADEDEEEDDDEEDRVPALGPDAESSDSDKEAPHARSPSPSPFFEQTNALLVQEKQQQGEEDGVFVVGMERLPPPGIEQVFEADPDADEDDGAHRLARPRSKLSRAERIAAAKARRANADALPETDEGKRWGVGPGGDVVQELKDVIWKVGEQRRLRERMHREEEEEEEDGKYGTQAAPVVIAADAATTCVVTGEADDVFTSSPLASPLPPT